MHDLVVSICSRMGRRPSEAEDWASKLDREWLHTLQQLANLDEKGWARIGLPVGLETELRRHVGGSTPAAAPAQQAPPARPSSASAGPRQAPAAQRPSSSPSPARVGGRGGSPWRPGLDAALLHGALRLQCGDAWPQELLTALWARHRDRVDQEGLLSALKQLGMAGIGATQVQAAIRAAQGVGSGSPPSVEQVVTAIHGPIRGPRASAVQGIFRMLDREGTGSLSASLLKRRCAPLELPIVHVARLSAEEALKSFVKPWKASTEVSEQAFLDAHIMVSALSTGGQDAFAQLLRRIWRMPAASVANAVPGLSRPKGGRIQADLAPEEFGDTALPASAGRRPQSALAARPAGKPSYAPDADPQMRREAAEEPEEPSRKDEGRSFMENTLGRSRSAKLINRLRSALRRRGPAVLAHMAGKFADKASDGLSPEELQLALNQVGVGVSVADVEELLRVIDQNGDGVVDSSEWLTMVRGPLSASRAAVVQEVFAHLAKGAGHISTAELQARFLARQHPEVQAGRRTAREALLDFMHDIGDITARGKLSFEDFRMYYEGVSAGIDNDLYFKHVARSVWGLDSDARALLARNAIRMYEGNIQITNGGLCGC